MTIAQCLMISRTMVRENRITRPLNPTAYPSAALQGKRRVSGNVMQYSFSQEAIYEQYRKSSEQY